MSNESQLVLVAGYQDLAVAHSDFDTLAAQAKAKVVSLEGSILVSKDADGNATLQDTCDHMGRKGAAWGSGVGVEVGLFAPPMLAAVAVGCDNGMYVDRAYADKSPYPFAGTVRKVVFDFKPVSHDGQGASRPHPAPRRGQGH